MRRAVFYSNAAGIVVFDGLGALNTLFAAIWEGSALFIQIFRTPLQSAAAQTNMVISPFFRMVRFLPTRVSIKRFFLLRFPCRNILQIYLNFPICSSSKSLKSLIFFSPSNAAQAFSVLWMEFSATSTASKPLSVS
jgi:hypothetical protein